MRPPPPPIQWEVLEQRRDADASLWRAAWNVIRLVFTGKGE